MHSGNIRRAAALALALSLAASAIAFADTVAADGDLVLAGDQGEAYVGEVAPGGTVEADVAFTLICQDSSHAAPGSTIAVVPGTTVVPAGGSVSATSGSFGPVPLDWPAAGTSCPSIGAPTLGSSISSHVTMTAPNVVGTGYAYTILFGRNPSSGTTGITSVTFTLDVVEPPAADTTPPVLTDVPSDISVEATGSDGAVVTWTDPTAVDDVDPGPVVACDPASGSMFPVGATKVTCTATDASGNAASATFDVTVSPPAHEMLVSWSAPMAGDSELVVHPNGRTIPVRVEVTVDGALLTASSGYAPTLRLDDVPACEPVVAATVAGSTDLGAMRWQDGRWALNVDARSLAPGCWRLVVVVDGADAGYAMLRVADAPPGLAQTDLAKRSR